MHQSEFKAYMDRQIVEINKYKENQGKIRADIDTNECVFEWIQKHAKSFRKKWNK